MEFDIRWPVLNECRGARALRVGLSALIAGALLAAGFSWPAAAEEPARPVEQIVDRSWIEVRSPNFVVLSRLPEAKTRGIVNELELFREVSAYIMPSQRLESPIPLHILLFARGDEWDWHAAPGSAAFFVPAMRGRFMVASADFQAVWTIKHEYVHFIMMNQGYVGYPSWYEEGLAEFLSTLHLDGSRVKIGGAHTIRRSMLHYEDWVPMERVLSGESLESHSDRERSMFYAQSWALVHYLIIGSEEDDEFMVRFSDYLKRMDAGKSSQEAFESAFDMTVKQLEVRLRKYTGRRSVRKSHLAPMVSRSDPMRAMLIPADRYSREWPIEVRTPAPGRLAYALGSLQLSMGYPEKARLLFERGLARDPKDAKLHAGLARAAAMEGRGDEASRHLVRAISVDPNDAVVRNERAASLIGGASAELDERTRTTSIREARLHLERTLESGDRPVESLAWLGLTYSILGDDPQRAYALLSQAAAQLPSSPEIRLWLAEASLAVGRDEEAEANARAVLVWARDWDWLTRDANNVLAMLAAMRQREAASATEPAAN